MKEERWQEILEMMREKFEVVDESTEPLEDGHGQVHSVIVNSPLGRIKLERTTRDRVVGEKAIGSKRIGSDVQIEKIFSKDDQVDFLKALKFNETTHEWEEFQPSQMGLS
ncbi:MAG: hypothetical protein V1853_03945 [bacterium]